MTEVLVDAAEFGVHIRQGGWRLGLLVARSVENLPHGGGSKSHARLTVGKVGAKEFARLSGTSADRVLRHLRAWDAAAEDGHVPASSTLTSGDEVDLDAETLPAWSDYYPPGDSNLQKASPEQRAEYERAAQDAGTTPSQVARVAASPQGIAAAIKASPKAASAASKALDERHDEWIASRPARAEARPDTNRDAQHEATALMVALRAAHRSLADAAMYAQNVRGDGETELREAMRGEVGWIRGVCDVLEVAANGGPLDAQLQDLLDAEAGR